MYQDMQAKEDARIEAAAKREVEARRQAKILQRLRDINECKQENAKAQAAIEREVNALKSAYRGTGHENEYLLAELEAKMLEVKQNAGGSVGPEMFDSICRDNPDYRL